jgi:hypothetical protein
MNTRTILMSSMIASTLLLSGGLALADQNAPIGHATSTAHRSNNHGTNAEDPFRVCADLSAQFDANAKAHKGIPSWQDAKAERAEGGKLCSQGATVAGIDHLQSALAQIGVIPRPYY